MKVGLAVILCVSCFSSAIIVCESRPMKIGNTRAIISALAPVPIYTVASVNQKDRANYLVADESLQSLQPMKQKYVGYLSSKDDVGRGISIMNNPQGHSPGVGHWQSAVVSRLTTWCSFALLYFLQAQIMCHRDWYITAVTEWNALWILILHYISVWF